MQSLIFATHNTDKLREARAILGVEVEGTMSEVPEIQSLDATEVITQKVQDYYKVLGTQLFAEDVSLVFHALGKLPGPYINDFSKQLGNDGLISLLDKKDDRTATATVSIGYIDTNEQVTIFQGTVDGTITAEERGDNGFGWDPIFIPDGETKTFAEMDAVTKNNYSMRGIAFREFKEWLDQQA